MEQLSYKIYALGCKVSQYDSARLAGLLRSAGFKAANSNARAVIVNACAVTGTAAKKAARTLALARKENPGAKIIVSGCIGELEKKNINPDPGLGADLLWGTKDLGALAVEIKRLFGTEGGATAKRTDYPDLARHNRRRRYTVKIQDGCEQFCTYCIIPYTRGRLRSRPEEGIIQEIKAAIAAGFEEIVLSGIHLGLYGRDLSAAAGRHSLLGLAKKISALPGLGRFRLSSIELNEVPDGLLGLMAAGRLCPHLHIPLQAGTDKTLKLMNRPYSLARFKDRIKEIRRMVPDIALSTDMIAGFPGESDADFEETLSAVKAMAFSRLHVFPFSARPPAPAGSLPGQISREVKLARAKKLRALGYRLSRAYREKFSGRELTVLPEKERDGVFSGKTEYYFDVAFTGDDLLDKEEKAVLGRLIKIRL